MIGETVLVALEDLDSRVAYQWAFGVGDQIVDSGLTSTVWEPTAFDLASLTKPLITAPVVLDALVNAGVPVDTCLDDVWKEWRRRDGRDDRRVTVEHLLTHSSGLPATLDAGMVEQSAVPALWDALIGAPLIAQPGARILYSDVGYALLPTVAEAISGSQWPDAVDDLCRRVGVGSLLAVNPAPIDGVAPGAAHDPMARVLGGVQGHAGAFGNARTVHRLLDWWFDLSERGVALRVRRDYAGGARTCGWAAHGDKWYILPQDWPLDSLCHTGFTGTSVAWHPGSNAWAILLTNAVTLGPDKPGLPAVRRRFHATVATALGLPSGVR